MFVALLLQGLALLLLGASVIRLAIRISVLESAAAVAPVDFEALIRESLQDLGPIGPVSPASFDWEQER